MNLHLMSVYSNFNISMVHALNAIYPKDENRFVLRDPFPGMKEYGNCVSDPSCFSVSYINRHATEYHHIFLHYNFLRPHEIMRLTDEAAAKIVWVVWGDDLYYVRHKYETPQTIGDLFRKASYIWSHHSLLYGIARQRAKHKIQLFHAIGIGYPFDEIMIRKRFGTRVPVVYAPVFSSQGKKDLLLEMRERHLQKRSDVVNVMIGHSGFPFHMHEKSLYLLSKYRNENIHINMVLSYGASKKRIDKLTKLAYRVFGQEKITVLTEMLPFMDYCDFLANMDVALFPFAHQAALGNTRRLAYIGTKLFLDQKGALAVGFRSLGVNTADYKRIRKLTWEEFCENREIPDTSAPLFSCYVNGSGIAAWKKLLS